MKNSRRDSTILFLALAIPLLSLSLVQSVLESSATFSNQVKIKSVNLQLLTSLGDPLTLLDWGTLEPDETKVQQIQDFILKAYPQVPKTRVSVYLVDKETYDPIPGLTTTIRFGIDSLKLVSDSLGKCVFDLENYTGSVIITTDETKEYIAGKLLCDVVAGNNLFIVEIAPANIYNWLLANLFFILLGVAGVVVAVVILILITRRKPTIIGGRR